MSKSTSVGTKFKVADTPVGGLTSIGGVEINADSIDVSAMDNTTGFKDYLAGLKDGGEVSAEGFLDGEDSGQDAMYEALNDGQQRTFAIVFPDAIGKTWQFNGIVTKFATNAQLGDAVKFSAAVKVSGKPTLAKTTTNTAS